MYYALRTIGYFLAWGTFYGFVLGVWSTTVIFPVLGTVMGALWGPSIGAACGLLCGVLAAVLQAFTFHADTNLSTYQRRLSTGIGWLTALAAPVALIASSAGVLWSYGGWPAEAEEFLSHSLAAATFWGGLAAAYVTYSYPPWLARLKINQAHEDFWPAMQMPFRSAWTTTRDALIVSLTPYLPSFWLTWLRLAPNETTEALAETWQVPAAILALAREMFNMPFIFAAFILFLGWGVFNFGTDGPDPIWLSTITVMVAGLLLIIGNGALLVFVKRLFLNDESHSPFHMQSLMTALAMVFTSILVGYYFTFSADLGFILLPWVLLIGWVVYRAYPAFASLQDKAKRKEKHADSKPKNTLALDEAAQNNDDDLLHETALTPPDEQAL